MSSAGNTRMLSLGAQLQCIHPCFMVLTGNRLEERRKIKGAAYYERKKNARKHLAQSKKDASVDQKTKDQLASYGY